MLNLNPNEGRKAIEGLSEPELQSLQLTAEGKSKPDIAKQIHRSTATIASHLKNCAIKLGVINTSRPTVAAVAKGYQLGLLS